MDMLDLSIVIVNWNTKDLVTNCILSIQETVKNISYEIIVVDNHSSDSSYEFISNRFPEVVVVTLESNKGFAYANNIGINLSKGKYIALINSDTLIINRCFELIKKYMDYNRDIGLAVPRVSNYDLSLQESCRNLPTLTSTALVSLYMHQLPFVKKYIKKPFMSDLEHYLRTDIEVASGCFWIFRRECLQSVGLLDERFFMYAEDVDICKRILDHKWQISYYPFAETIHYGGKSSSLSPIHFYIEMQKSMCMYWEKHYSKLSNKIYMILLFVHHLNRIMLRLLLCVGDIKGKNSINNYKVKRSWQCLQWILNYTDPKKA